MICPHCNKAFHEKFEYRELAKDSSGQWYCSFMLCPACENIIVKLENEIYMRGGGIIVPSRQEILVHPRVSNYSPAPSEVPKGIAQDYNEACLVLNDSPRASAALSRRCLQSLLSNVLTTDKTNIIDLIDIAIKELPKYLADDIDAVRNIGNFAAHPNKNLETDEILDVEPNEAEWNLEVLQGLFDFYYVQKKRSEERRAKLNEKLEVSGKPPMKKVLN